MKLFEEVDGHYLSKATWESLETWSFWRTCPLFTLSGWRGQFWSWGFYRIFFLPHRVLNNLPFSKLDQDGNPKRSSAFVTSIDTVPRFWLIVVSSGAVLELSSTSWILTSFYYLYLASIVVMRKLKSILKLNSLYK